MQNRSGFTSNPQKGCDNNHSNSLLEKPTQNPPQLIQAQTHRQGFTKHPSHQDFPVKYHLHHGDEPGEVEIDSQ